MKHLSLKDVQESIKKKDQKRNEAFDQILSSCYKHIQKCVDTMRTTYFCFFEVPEFVLGYPLYDLNSCISYIQDTLVRNGFKVKYLFPRILFITWFPNNSKECPSITHEPKKEKPQRKTAKNRRTLFL
jgi:hypothetical protein